MSRFSAQTREKIVIGSHVIGKSKAIDGWIGTVERIIGQALQKKFFIRWHNHENHGADGEDLAYYPKRSFQLYSSRNQNPRASERPHAGPPARYVDAAPFAAAAADDSVHSESVTGSEDSDQDVEGEDDGDPGDGIGEAPADEGAVASASNGAPGAPQAAPNIVQLQHWDPGYVLTMDKKDRDRVIDRVTWTVRSSIPENLHNRVHGAPTTFNWDVIGKDRACDKTAFDYWQLVVPTEALRQEVLLTNNNIDIANAANARGAPPPASPPAPAIPRTTLGEIIRKHGLRLAMTLIDVDKPTSWFWSVEASGCGVTTPPAFGSRFGMSRNRFMQLEQYEQFCPQPPDSASDPWWHVRALVNWFNARRKAIMKCGPFICEDESGAWWLGRDAEKLPDWLGFAACPHVTYMKKKPKQHFVEFKNLCDVLTGVMIALEIQEGSAPMRSKLFCDQYPSHIALSLRLLQTAGLLHTWRVLIADAAFGSVSACKALLQHGMLSMMIVKQSHTMFPLKSIRDWAKTKNPKLNPEHKGSTLIYCASVDEHRIAAIGYMHQNVRTIVTSYGNTGAGSHVVEERKALVTDADGQHNIVTEHIQIPCPTNVADMIAGFGAIDQHNALRQGILKLEYQKKTFHWWKRVATTIDGMHVTDAYRIFCFDKANLGEEAPSFKDFCDTLARQLIFNIHLQERQLRPGSIDGLVHDEHVISSVMELGKAWYKVVDGEAKTSDVRGYCRVCKKKTAYWCKKCSVIPTSNTAKRSIVYVCNPAKRDCFYRHSKDPEDDASDE
jgi:hypothetical protein